MVLDKDEIEDDDEVVSPQKRRKIRTPSAQLEDIEGLFPEFELVENVESCFGAPVVTSSQKGSIC